MLNRPYQWIPTSTYWSGMTTKNDRARKFTPASGEIVISGAIRAPARPASAEPNAKVLRYTRDVLIASADAISTSCVIARIFDPKSVR